MYRLSKDGSVCTGSGGEIKSILEKDLIDKLEKEDKEKLAYFLDILIQESKYQHLKKEIEDRREEIRKGSVLSHDEIWKQMNV